MNKSDLIDAIADRVGGRQAATVAVESFIDTVTRAVSKGERVAISGFGVFEKTDRAARTGRNPATGAIVKIKKTSVPKFRPGTEFKAYVNGSKKFAKATAASGAAKAAPATRTAAVKKAAPAAKAAPAKAAATKAPAKKTAAAATKAPARATATKAVKTAATKAPAKKTTAAKAPARKVAATKAVKTTAAKAPAKKTTARKTAR